MTDSTGCDVLKIYRYKGKCNVSGRNIRLLREREKLSQEQLAARLQLKGLPVSQKAISRMETGERVVADFELVLLADVFHVDVTALLKDEE